MIRVIIVAEVRLYRDGIGMFLDATHDVEVAGSGADLGAALAAIEQELPDIVLLEAPTAEASLAIRRIAEVAAATRIVALSIADDEADVLSWAEAGASGYLTREDSLATLTDVVRSVVRDEMPCTPRMAATLIRRVGTLAAAAEPAPAEARLTTREREIVGLIEHGLSNKQIASELCIETTTVKNHVHNILEKLDVHHRADAVERVRGRRPAREFVER
jgi:DNA-binding NarL/FixJ family response regulator